jgi:DNA-binding NarL/FixJ family response regulator
VLAGGLYTAPDACRRATPRIGRVIGVAWAFARLPPTALTHAQSRVLALLAEGRSNREIAESLGLAEGTVKVHVTRIFRALKVNSRAQVLLVLSREDRARRS